MNQFLGILIAFLVFSFIVFFHELGHFLLARKGGIGVEEFAVGMGPKLWSKKKGETLYSIRLLPIGGFCAMLGEDEAGGGLSSDKEEKNIANDPKAFNNRPLSARFLAILAGPMFNFILALFFAVVLILAVGSVRSTVIDVVDPEYPAFAAGIQKGDKLLRVDGHKILDPIEATTYILVSQGKNPKKSDGYSLERIQDLVKPVEVEVLRGNEVKHFSIRPKASEQGNQILYQIGIGYENVTPNLFETLYYALLKFLSMIKMTFFTLFALFSGQISMGMLSGPVGIVNALSKSYGVGMAIRQFIATFSGQVVLLSANLGVMNLLPIPALDGGRLVFLLIELVRGKPIDPKKEGYIHFAGFVLLMLLMAFIFYTDIVKLFE